MGVTHFKAIREVQGAEVVALCTRDPKKLNGDWRNIRGNFGDSGGVQDLTNIRKYQKIEDILADPDIDLIDICLPTPLHKEVTLAAIEAGKHVLLEKPIALHLDDADRMIAAARQAGKLFMVAQVLRFFPEFAFVKEALDSGRYGAFLGAHFKRIISKPDWSGENWFAYKEKSGGPAIDLHIHDSDFVRYLFGMPERVSSLGVKAPDGQVTYLVTQYFFEGKNWCVTAHSGAVSMPCRSFEHGFDVYFEAGTLQYDSSWGQPLHLLTADGGHEHPELPSQDGFIGEIQYAVDCIREGKEPVILSAESARESLRLCHREIESVLTGEPVTVAIPSPAH